MSTISNKTALITGASSGIGAVYADRLAARGHDLILVARRADRLDAIAAQIRARHGVQVETLVADLASDAGQASVEQLLMNRPVSILVNNAGIARLAPISPAGLADSMAQIALNVTALTRLTHAVLPGMQQRNEGTIINIASVMALNTMPMGAVYSATKAYVLALSRTLQQELAGSAVKVQVVLPAATATEVWDNSGVPLSAMAPGSVMTTDNLVDAALRGLDLGESATWPSVADTALIERIEADRIALFRSAQTGQVAPRLTAK